MKLGFRNRVLFTIFMACMVCSAAAVFVSRHRIARNGEDALIEKSRAILSRLEVGRAYVAEQGGLDEAIKKLVVDHPDGKIDEEDKLFILRRVPIYSSIRLGQEGAEKEHYRFRIFADDPRNKDNTPTSTEKEYLKRFETSTENEIVERVEDGKSLAVMRPIRISKAQGCLNCHGHPSTSPLGNGKDILGYKMEDWSDGMIHGSFAVISSLEPVVAQTEAATREIMLWAAGFTLLALGMGFLMVRGPIGAILQATSELKEAGEQVGSASGQLSGVSQGLSSSSNEAAASLEETVSSLEELSSMVSRNTENAKEAAALSNASRSAAEKGEGEISELINAMGSISDSAKKMEDIINVIDDIAFQTNLLALNAAVEAARAGEQGKGFAVVAEAVRNLAQRSAQAAKEINVLIKDSGQRVEAGAEIADSSGAVLKEIVNSVKKVADLNTEIATASQEQSSGLNQISQAMNQLDKTTQHNAALG